MSSKYRALVEAAERLCRTPIMDDDFPEMKHRFDGALRDARVELDAAEQAGKVEGVGISGTVASWLELLASAPDTGAPLSDGEKHNLRVAARLLRNAKPTQPAATFDHSGCPFAVTKGGHSICQPPRRMATQPAAPDLPGMWEASDFTGGDPDERCHSERAATQQPVATVHSSDTPGHFAIITPALPRGTKLYAAPAPPSREVEALVDRLDRLAAMYPYSIQRQLRETAELLRSIAPVQEKR